MTITMTKMEQRVERQLEHNVRLDMHNATELESYKMLEAKVNAEARRMLDEWVSLPGNLNWRLIVGYAMFNLCCSFGL